MPSKQTLSPLSPSTSHRQPSGASGRHLGSDRFAASLSTGRTLAATCLAASALVAPAATLTAPASGHAVAQASRPEQDAAEVARVYLVGPKDAADLGCSIAWQTFVPMAANQSLTLVGASNKGILALNSRNELTLVRPDSGDRAWSASAAQLVDKIFALDIVDVQTGAGAESRVMVTTDSGAYGLDAKDGASILRKRFKAVPSTRPIVAGDNLIFGTRAGQLAWFNCATGFERRAYTIDGPIGQSPLVAAPVARGGRVAAASSEGTVVVLEESSGASFWRKKLLAGVRATPAIGDGALFVASEDQYLYAFDLDTGTTLWKHFTQAPLTTPPFVAGDMVFQSIPGEGLVAFTQKSDGNLAGNVRWKRTGLAGAPVSTTEIRGGGALVLWCPDTHTVTMVSMSNGDIVGMVELPKVDHLVADALEPRGFVAWSRDGRIQRLSPMKAAAPAPASGEPASNG